jgi:hypothetical protein
MASCIVPGLGSGVGTKGGASRVVVVSRVDETGTVSVDIGGSHRHGKAPNSRALRDTLNEIRRMVPEAEGLVRVESSRPSRGPPTARMRP